MVKWKKTCLWILFVVSSGGLLLVECGRLQLHLTGHNSGLYLLKGEGGGYVLADDLYLGEEEQLLAALDFASLRRGSKPQSPALTGAALELDWNTRDGEGVIHNHLDGQRELRIHFSRYRDSNQRYPRGLFIGGATAGELVERRTAEPNNSGMSYFDGSNWRHIWCNTNEGIGSTVSREGAAPSAWTFLGSRVLRNDAEEVRLASDHRLVLDGVPLTIEREVTVDAGDPYVQLSIRITNRGEQAAHYLYFYGDEPWLGDFGSSTGDIGWLPDRPVYYEENVDPRHYSFVGMMDVGNQVIGEGRIRSPVANFIEWRNTSRPDAVFFANRYFGYNHPEEMRVPLMGNSRSVGLFWRPRVLEPGATQTIELVVGMADFDPARGLPTRPSQRRPAALATVKTDPRIG